MQSQTTAAAPVDDRAARNQRRLIAAAWAMAALLAALIVLLLVQGARLADLERAVEQSAGAAAAAGMASSDSMQLDDVCRLLGAVAQKQDLDLASVFTGSTLSTCEYAAGQGASAVRAAG